MPPSAAPEWDRVGWIFEIIATSAPASNASMAARMPAQPAPTTRTSCSAITLPDATSTPPGDASDAWAGLCKLGIGERLEVLAEHPRVDGRPLRQERRPEAGGERRLRLGHADLRACELGREAGEEVVERLRPAQARDRRQDSEGIRSEEDDVLRMARQLGRQRVRD